MKIFVFVELKDLFPLFSFLSNGNVMLNKLNVVLQNQVFYIYFYLNFLYFFHRKSEK